MPPTNAVPNMSARYAGTVAKPPPYIVRMMQYASTKSAIWPDAAKLGTRKYSTAPSAKKMK